MTGNIFVFTRANCAVVSEFARSNPVLKQMVNSDTHWNRLTILNGAKYEKQVILDLIMKDTYPYDIYPCMYTVEDEDSFFLFRNGFSAVLYLCSKNLYVIDPFTDDNIDLTITAQYKPLSELPLNPLRTLEQVVARRIIDSNFKVGYKDIDLGNLRNDPGLEHIYCSFNSFKFVEYLLDVLKKLAPLRSSLILSRNNIELVEALDEFSKSSLDVLDLRHNKITREGFRKMNKGFIIGHLLLEGNPMLSEYLNPANYFADVKRIVAKVNKIDFIRVNERDAVEFPTIPVYIKDPRYKTFVDHFLFHNFNLFGRDRKQLLNAYHERATFSMSLYKITPGQLKETNSNYLGISVEMISRNILDVEEEATGSSKHRLSSNLYHGREKIAAVLSCLPEIDFIYKTFTVDVPMINDAIAIISCSGVCQAMKPLCNKQYYVTRKSILVPSPNHPGKWDITNDMWNITHGLTLYYKTNRLNNENNVKGDFAVVLNPQLKDKRILKNIVGKMTKMKESWVEKFLEESDWDFEFTLQSFTDQFKADVIPVDAFDIPAETLEALKPLVKALKEKQAQLGIETEIM